MKKWLIPIIIIIIAAITISAYFLIIKPQTSPTNLATCNVLSYSSPQAKNLVFFSPKQQAQEYSHYLLSQQPFSQNKQALNFYYIDSYTPICELYKNIAILCYNKELVQQASSCPNDFIIVIDDKQTSNIRSSSYMNVLSLNSAHSKTVILHELGHSLAFLADEYVPSTLPNKQKNCVTNCKSFSVSDGCFEGCSKDNYYRSIQLGVMRTLSSSEYGSLNNQLILANLPSSSTITGKAISEDADCSNEKYYLIEGTYQENTITILSQAIEQGCLGSNGIGDFDYKLILQDNSVSQAEFNPELIFTDSEQDGEVLISTTNFYLKLPIIENAKTLEISKNQQILSQINLLGLDARPCRK